MERKSKNTIKVRVFNKKSLKEEARYFINEWCAMKFMRKLRHRAVYQVVGTMERVTREG